MIARRVLLVDDDSAVRDALGQTLELEDLTPVLVRSYIEAKDHITPEFPGIIVSDIRMPGKDGFALLDYAQGVDPDLPVILLTGEGDVPMAVRGISAGAFDFIEKPCASREFIAVVEKALRARGLVLENRALKQALARGDAASRLIFGTSTQAEDLRSRIRSVARTAAQVLVTGPSGSGTSKVAEVIHLLSPVASHPYVKRSAAALTPDTLSEAIEAAGAGSLFIDEIAALDPATQLALLDALDDGTQTRVLAGTYRDLAIEAAEGRFSEDLFFKLDVLRVRIPGLSERPEDIPVLFHHYVALASEQANLSPPAITPAIAGRLMAQDWPGNARALMNAAMRFAIGLGDTMPDYDDRGLAEQMAEVERRLLIGALERAGGRAAQAAQALKLPRKTFYDRLSRHALRPEDYKSP
jgi:two-component system C4-dicarboxylate transport response regulator DctD